MVATTQAVPKNIEQRLIQHQSGKGAKYTATRVPVKLVYLEEYSRIDEAFFREKQVQGWNRKKKEALMRSDWESLKELAKCKNASTSLSNRDGVDILSGDKDKGNALSEEKGGALSGGEGGALSGVEGGEDNNQ